MASTPNFTNIFLLTILIVLLPIETYAFGAGDIPDFAYLNDKAFRHGDIENILETLVKTSGAAAIGGSGLLGFASSVFKHVSGGSKFSKSDVKKVYFGNWLRDYSQAMDIAGLSKLSADTLVLIVSVLGFMTFGFASNEFQVTADRLGVYLPVEHIDNPKGYAEKEGDARSFHPKLRPPVSPRELEIDPHTGMKKYIATEDQGWDTSTAFIRRTFRACIQYGRRARGKEDADLWEAYRLLGQGLHTMEDLLAHSNWCELALRKMGHTKVFCHVGDHVTVNTPNGGAPPLVTGTFGSADFIHSLLEKRESNKLSQASVTDLSAKMDNSAQGNGPDLSFLKSIMGKLGGGQDKINQAEEIKQQAKAYDFNPNNIAPPEVQRQLLDLLKWHDDVLKSVIEKIEMVPGLSNLIDGFSNALNEYIYTVLAPYLGPILSQATGVLSEGSKAVIDNDDQYEVFNNPNASDPSHSLLSKDHFGLILNEPAGKIAQIVVIHSVNLIVEAWSNDNDADAVITQILEAFHHPYYATGRSEIQQMMIDHMEGWIGDLGSEASSIIESLTKESVRDHKNKRHGLEDTEEAGYGGCGHGSKPSKPSGYVATSGGSQSHGQASHSTSSNQGYQTSSTDYNTQSQHQPDVHGGGRTNTSGYGSQRDEGDNSYGRRYVTSAQETSYGERREAPDHSGRQETPSYGERRETLSYGRRQETPSYGGRQETQSYGTYGEKLRQETSTYGHQQRRDNVDDIRGSTRTCGGQSQPDYTAQSGGYNPSYGQSEVQIPSYGDGQGEYRGSGRHSKHDFDNEKKYKSSQPSYGRGCGGNEYGRSSKKNDDDDDDDDDKRRKHGHRDDSDDDGKPRRHHEGYSQQGGQRKNEQPSHQPAYGQPLYGQEEYTQQESYGQREFMQQESYGRQEYGQQESYGQQFSYGQSGYGLPQREQSEYGQETSGYAPSYEGRDETFGAERLDIGGSGYSRDEGDDDEGKRKHHRPHGGGNRY